jgi:hypothetical protein
MTLSSIHRAIARAATRSATRNSLNRWDGVKDIARINALIALANERARKNRKNEAARMKTRAKKLAKAA